MCCLKKCERNDFLKLMLGFGNEAPLELRKAMRRAIDNLDGVSFSPEVLHILALNLQRKASLSRSQSHDCTRSCTFDNLIM